MKKLIAVLVLVTSLLPGLMAQDKEASTVWAVHHFTPKNLPAAEMNKRIIEHDNKFHEGKSAILNIVTGDNSGDILWAYGPLTYAEMDNRKLPEGHDADNMDLNNKYIEEYHSMTLWKLQPDMSVDLGDEVENYATRNHSTYKLKRGSWEPFKELVAKHVEVYKKHKLAEIFFYTADYGTKDGHNLLLISPFKNFASFDDDWGYKEKFEAVHGKGSLKETTDKLNGIIEESYTFLTVVVPKE